MKRGVLFVVVMVLCIGIVSAATSSVYLSTSNSDVNLQIEMNRYAPIPVEPGEYFDLWVSVTPVGTSSTTSIINQKDLTGVKLELVESYPFTLDTGTDNEQDIGTLELGEEAMRHYRVRVADDAAAGTAGIKFKFSSDADKVQISPELDISVQVLDHTLNIISIETEPEKLVAGQVASIDIKIQNDATGRFKDIKAILDIDGSAVPIVPYKSSKEQIRNVLEVGEAYTFSYSVIVEEDAKAGVYKIPVKFNYRDINNTVYSKNDTFGLLIGSEADLEFNLEEFDVFQTGESGEFVVSVSNVGPSDVKYLTLELLDGEGYVLLGPSKEYLGNVESDDFETSRFKVYLEGSDDQSLNYKVSYKDTYNNDIEETFSLNLPVYSAEEISRYGLEGNTKSYVNYMIYVLLALIVYYFINGWRKLGSLESGVSYAIKQILKLPFRLLFIFSPRKVALWPKKIKAFFNDF
jgi:hypothetical protein